MKIILNGVQCEVEWRDAFLRIWVGESFLHENDLEVLLRLVKEERKNGWDRARRQMVCGNSEEPLGDCRKELP